MKNRHSFHVPLTRKQREAFAVGMQIARRLGLSELDLGPRGSVTLETVLARVRALALASGDAKVAAAAEALIQPDGTPAEALRQQFLRVDTSNLEGIAAFEAGLREGAESAAVA